MWICKCSCLVTFCLFRFDGLCLRCFCTSASGVVESLCLVWLLLRLVVSDFMGFE